MKRACLLVAGVMAGLVLVMSSWVNAQEPDVIQERIEMMTTEEKIAQMLMPDFRWSCISQEGCDMTEMTPEVEALLKRRSFGGVILFSQNIADTEQTVRLIDAMQRANASNERAVGQLLMAVDQEGGYVTRLAYGTNMPGNMALGATGDKDLAYEAAEVIGAELEAIGFNVDFAPVSDVNNNPRNPVIGVRSFGDDPVMVGEYATEFMKGLQSKGIVTSLKHFPGHGDTSTDTHVDTTVVDKSLEELKGMELVPFRKLIEEGADMIMTTHIQYPQIETETYVSRERDESGARIVLNLPATLSEKIITGLLRGEMGFNGVVVTDALDMGAISAYFETLDIARLAINVGVDMLLVPVNTSGAEGIRTLDQYVSNVANLVDSGEISLEKVDTAVKRILTLKKDKGLMKSYSVDVDAKVKRALELVSTKESHEQELEIAKKAVTLVKNNDNVLPIQANNKVLVAYGYTSHLNAVKYALDKLAADGKTDGGSVIFCNFEDGTETIKKALNNVDKIIIINAMYTANGFSGFDGGWDGVIDDLIDAAHEKAVRVVLMSTQLPYDVARFNNADAIVTTYLANGLGFDELMGMEKNIPKYGANVIAGVYQMFDVVAEMSGELPVNIYKVDAKKQITDEVLYARGRGLSYMVVDSKGWISNDKIFLPVIIIAGAIMAIFVAVLVKKH